MKKWSSKELPRPLKAGAIDPAFIFEEKQDIRSIYIVKSKGLHKIGYATDVNRRLASMSCGSSEPMWLIWEYKTDEYVYLESLLHAAFRHKHHHGEWFNLTIEDIRLAKRICAMPTSVEVDLNDPRIEQVKAMKANGYTCREIAVVMSVSASTVSRLCRVQTVE